MNATKSFILGIKRATSEGKMLLLLWFFNVLFASVVYLQFSDYLDKVLGTSAAASDFLKGFDFNSVFEMLNFDGAALGTIISLAITLALFYGVFSIFLSGGILETLFAGREPDAPGETGRLAPLFFKGAGKFFGRFFRLFLYSLALFAGAAVLVMILFMILSPLTRNSTSEALLFYIVLGEVIVGLFLFFLVRVIVDYARIRIVAGNSRAVLRPLLESIGFVFRRFGKAIAIYYLYLLTGVVVVALYWLIRTWIKTTSLLPILIAFALGQVFILSRGWLRVGLQAAQMDFFRSAVPPTPVEEAVPASEPTAGESVAPEPGPKSGEVTPQPAPSPEAAPDAPPDA
jgi:hypothetical protein